MEAVKQRFKVQRGENKYLSGNLSSSCDLTCTGLQLKAAAALHLCRRFYTHPFNSGRPPDQLLSPKTELEMSGNVYRDVISASSILNSPSNHLKGGRGHYLDGSPGKWLTLRREGGSEPSAGFSSAPAGLQSGPSRKRSDASRQSEEEQAKFLKPQRWTHRPPAGAAAAASPGRAASSPAYFVHQNISFPGELILFIFSFRFGLCPNSLPTEFTISSGSYFFGGV